MKMKLIVLLTSLTMCSIAQATSYISPVTLIGGTAIDFEGKAEGTLIGAGVYAGVTFSQPDGGRPQIDNSPFLFGYTSSSGTGVLTGSMEGGAPFPTVAGLIASFSSGMNNVEAFMSDTSPLGNYSVSIFGLGGGLLETLNIPSGTAITPGAYVGFTRASADIFSIQFGPGAAFGDAFAIDDLRFAGSSAVPDGGNSLILVSLGVVGLLTFRRKLVKS